MFRGATYWALNTFFPKKRSILSTLPEKVIRIEILHLLSVHNLFANFGSSKFDWEMLAGRFVYIIYRGAWYLCYGLPALWPACDGSVQCRFWLLAFRFLYFLCTLFHLFFVVRLNRQFGEFLPQLVVFLYLKFCRKCLCFSHAKVFAVARRRYFVQWID